MCLPNQLSTPITVGIDVSKATLDIAPGMVLRWEMIPTALMPCWPNWPVMLFP